MNGTVESITTDWRGDTLAAGTLTSDTEIAVRDIADFDEDGGWLTIADSSPIAYVSTNDDAIPVVTLVGTVGAVFEAGDPVVVWDPTVLPAGAKVVEYVASVMTDRGAVPATIPHSVVPLAGVDRLIGASVSLDEDDDGDWYVAQVYGRESAIDQSYLDVPLLILYLPANQTIPNDGTNFTTLSGWAVKKSTDDDLFDVNAATGEVTVREDGVYGLFPASVWIGNSSGKRTLQPVTNLDGVDEILTTVPGSPPDAVQYSQRLSMPWPLLAGTKIRVEVQQTSGIGLDVRGGTGGRFTQFGIVRWQA